MTEELRGRKKAMMKSCNDYFDMLAKELKGSHVIVGSCNKDTSRYLVLAGTEDQISYYGKPIGSFRVSDHWNWRAGTHKCVDPRHVQCFSRDLHFPFRRPQEGMASKPVMACCVGYYGADNSYHIIYGEVYNPRTRKTSFICKSIYDAIAEMQEDLLDIWERRIA